jgi:hypothetical protein
MGEVPPRCQATAALRPTRGGIRLVCLITELRYYTHTLQLSPSRCEQATAQIRAGYQRPSRPGDLTRLPVVLLLLGAGIIVGGTICVSGADVSLAAAPSSPLATSLKVRPPRFALFVAIV